ncbi:MAG: hypothetical protein NTZ53_11130 [Cyanobacteria bacterium]|nr:hypothetical protein [Cyanobacteriota bacterium]
MDSLAPHQLRSPASRRASGAPASAADRVLHSELKGRNQDNDALSMMVTSMVRMVQAGKGSDSRWSAS